MQSTVLKLFRKIAFSEGVSFLLLGFTMILKYKFNYPLPNYIVGMAHGVLFIGYLFFLGWLFLKENWSFKNLIFSFIASLIPLGTFLADKHIFSKK